MEYILTLTNEDINITQDANTESTNVDLTASVDELNITPRTDITTEDVSMLVHNVMKGDKGDDGPNVVNTTTQTTFTGLIKGNGTTIEQAIEDVDYIKTHQSLDEYRKASAQDIIDLNLSSSIDTINEKIPPQATSSNQLADKNFVNSSISTSTATFRGTSPQGLDYNNFIIWANGLAKDKNDYIYWDTVDEVGNRQFRKYVYSQGSWAYEYTLNNSSFTAAQWASINSGITSGKVGNYDAHLSSTSNPHSVTKAQVGLGNVPNTDFTSRVETLEGKTKLSNFTDDLGSSPVHTHSQYLTEHQSLADYSTTQQMNTAIANHHDSTKVNANNAITGATKCKITYDSKGLVTGGADLQASDIPSIPASKLSDVTATATELNYCDGVTSNIQAQLNGKQETLVSGSNIKTINNTSILGSGNISTIQVIWRTY